MQESGQENGFYRKVNENIYPSLSPTETEKAIVAEVLANFPANFRFLGWHWLCKGRTDWSGGNQVESHILLFWKHFPKATMWTRSQVLPVWCQTGSVFTFLKKFRPEYKIKSQYLEPHEYTFVVLHYQKSFPPNLATPDLLGGAQSNWRI